jgi:hypothetical protein
MDLRYHASVKSFAGHVKITGHSNNSQRRPFSPSSQGMPVAKFLSRARRVPIVYFFVLESAPLTKVSQQAHGRLAGKNGKVGSRFFKLML